MNAIRGAIYRLDPWFTRESDESLQFKYRAQLSNAVLYLVISACYYTRYTVAESPRMNVIAATAVVVLYMTLRRYTPYQIAFLTLVPLHFCTIHWVFEGVLGTKVLMAVGGPLILFAGAYTDSRVAAFYAALDVVVLAGLRAFEMSKPASPLELPFVDVLHNFVTDGETLLVLLFIFLILRYAVVITRLQNYLREMSEREKDLLRRKQVFLAETTHEIRSPMTAVFQLTELLTAAATPPQSADGSAAPPMTLEMQASLIAALQTACRSLMKFLNQFIDVARLDVAEVQQVPFDLHGVLRDATLAFEAAATLRRLTLEVVLDKGVPRFARGDPLFLTKIIMNLVSNGLKFTDVGGVKVRATVEAAGKDGTVAPASANSGAANTTFNAALSPFTLVCAVSDTGRGIVLDAGTTVEDLFTPYYRPSGINTHVPYGATGLGLSICKSAVDKLGGRIELQPSSAGTTVVFRVPLAPCALTDELNLLSRSNSASISRANSEMARDGQLLVASGPDAAHKNTLATAATSSSSSSAPGRRRTMGLLARAEEDALLASMNNGRDADEDDGFGRWPSGGAMSSSPGSSLASSPTPSPRGVTAAPSTGSTGVASPSIEAPSTPTALNDEPSQRPSRWHILLMEDTGIIRRVVRMSLERLGHTCVTAENGRVGVERFTEALGEGRRAFDVVLADCHMDVMTGWDATRVIRSEEAARGLKPTPIIAVTANTTRDCRVECAAVGMDAIVEKPFETRALLEVVAAVRAGGALSAKYALH